jgi:tRNA threonylcarbamoyladenosine biosynthesis protein TsaB
VVSAAVVEDRLILGEAGLNIRQGHMERLLPVIDQVLSGLSLALQDIDAFAVAVGPGSFTSLRVGIATAKAFAHTLGKPLVGVPTLDALAEGLYGTSGLICPVLTARAQEVYASFYVSVPAPGRVPDCVPGSVSSSEAPVLNRANLQEAAPLPQVMSGLASTLRERAPERMRRLSGYLAVDPRRLVESLKNDLNARVTFTGEGALAWWDDLREGLGDRAVLAEPAQLWPRGALIAAMGQSALEQRPGNTRPAAIRALYVKPPAIRRK